MAIKRIFEISDDARVAASVSVEETSSKTITLICNNEKVAFEKSMAMDVLEAITKLIE